MTVSLTPYRYRCSHKCPKKSGGPKRCLLSFKLSRSFPSQRPLMHILVHQHFSKKTTSPFNGKKNPYTVKYSINSVEITTKLQQCSSRILSSVYMCVLVPRTPLWKNSLTSEHFTTIISSLSVNVTQYFLNIQL